MSKPETIVNPGFENTPPKKRSTPKIQIPSATKKEMLLMFQVPSTLLYK